jgi:hypothetical protein
MEGAGAFHGRKRERKQGRPRESGKSLAGAVEKGGPSEFRGSGKRVGFPRLAVIPDGKPCHQRTLR